MEHPAGEVAAGKGGQASGATLSPGVSPWLTVPATPRAGPDQSLGTLSSGRHPTPSTAIRALGQVKAGFCPHTDSRKDILLGLREAGSRPHARATRGPYHPGSLWENPRLADLGLVHLLGPSQWVLLQPHPHPPTPLHPRLEVRARRDVRSTCSEAAECDPGRHGLSAGLAHSLRSPRPSVAVRIRITCGC